MLLTSIKSIKTRISSISSKYSTSKISGKEETEYNKICEKKRKMKNDKKSITKLAIFRFTRLDMHSIYTDSLVNQINKIILVNYNSEINYSIIDFQKSSAFYSSNLPSISISSYVKRIINNSNIQSSTILLIGIYFDRFCNVYDMIVTKNNIFR